jgi:hypothetical protein
MEGRRRFGLGGRKVQGGSDDWIETKWGLELKLAHYRRHHGIVRAGETISKVLLG